MGASSSLKLLALVLALLAVSECCVSDDWSPWLDHAFVSIENDLWNGSSLSFHCKSKDDDLGTHVLEYQQAYQWDFKINFWGSTLFWCNFAFTDKSGRSVQGGYQIYRAKRDVKRCGQACTYSARSDGLYVWRDNKGDEMAYPWPYSL